MSSSSIDSLTDDVICHILSFLPTRISASTNVLSKRWRFLWAHVPNLNFKGDDFEDQTRASDIITRAVVLHRAKTIITFRLFDDVSCTFYQLATWIAHAVNRGVRNLNLDFESFTPPRCLLTCTTLVDLKLRRCRRIIPSGGNLFLPSLKKLHLSRIMYEDEESLPRLLSGCPVLEDLIVEGCFKNKQIVSAFDVDGDDLSCVFVSSLTVKTFSVDLSVGCRVLKINLPSLVYLEVKNCYWEDFTSLGTMTSLIGAHFSLIGDLAEYVRVLQFLNSLCNVKCLKFSIDHYRKGVSIPRLDSLVKFDNLTKLEFNLLVDFDEIVKFLQVADNLQVLKFTLCGMHKTYREPKKVPTCMLSRLKTVQIKLSDGFHARDFKTIKYLLRNAQVLETMEICDKSYHCFKKKRLGMLRRISLLEKGSESCQLVFNNPMFL